MSAVLRTVAAAGLLASPLVVSRHASAQSLDYSAYEQLFGEPVTDSVTGQPQRASEVAADMEVITADQIRRSGADSIPEILRFVPGLDVREYGERDAVVSIRGNEAPNNPRVLVLLDGRQVYEDDYGLTIWSLIPVALSEIRQIEIIKGPAAALYGFNAVSGVINIVTFDPLRDRQNTVFVDGGTQSQAYGEAVGTVLSPGQYGVRLAAEGFRSAEFDGAVAGNTRVQPHTGSVDVDGRVMIAPGVEWATSASIGSADTDFFADVGAYSPFSFRANSVRTRVAADTSVGLLQFDVYRNENRVADVSPLEASNWREDVVVVDANDVVKLDRSNTIRVAAEFRDNEISSLLSFDGRTGYQIGAGSLMWNLQAAPGVTITNAVRVDDLSLGQPDGAPLAAELAPLRRGTTLVEPSFNSGAVIRLDPTDTVRLTAARAVQLPSLFSFGVSSTYADGGLILAGNTALRPSAVSNLEIDLDRQLATVPSTVRLASFAQRTDTTLGSPFGSGFSVLPSGRLLLIARNFGSSEEAGGELEWFGKLRSNFHWSVGYALAAVRDDTPDDELATATSVNFERETPTHAVTGEVGYDWDRFELDLRARWQSHFEDFQVSSLFEARAVTIPNYVVADARLAYRMARDATAALTIDQFNARSALETAGNEVDRRILASVRLDL